MNRPSDGFPLTVKTAIALLRARELSAVELVERTLRRIEETEPLVHAYVAFDAERALCAAGLADQGPASGALAGIPFAVKDVIDVAGMPTLCGSRALPATPVTSDAAVVRDLRQEKAIVLGKHATHELTCGLDEPPTRNPWNLDHYPGGSSAGGGVSVAVGSCLFALGTDAAGSVRIPAAMTGVAGLKPTYGRVSTAGVAQCATAPSIDHIGILARTVEDLAIVFEAAAERHEHDPVRQAPERRPCSGGLGEGPGAMRLGVIDEAGTAGLTTEVREAFDDALSVLSGVGAALTSVALPSFNRARQAVFALFSAGLATSHRTLLERPDHYSDAVYELLVAGARLHPRDVSAAERVRASLRSEVQEAFDSGGLDALVMPTTPLTSMPLAAMEPRTDIARYIPYTCPFNLTGNPALSVPCGMTAAGLPVGLQVVARPFDEHTALRIGRAYETATEMAAAHLAAGLLPGEFPIV